MPIGLIAVLLLLLCGHVPVAAQPAPAPINAAIYVAPPFIEKTASDYTGFAWELWHQVAGELKLTYDVQPVDTVAHLLQLVRDKQVDVAIANLSTRVDMPASAACSPICGRAAICASMPGSAC